MDILKMSQLLSQHETSFDDNETGNVVQLNPNANQGLNMRQQIEQKISGLQVEIDHLRQMLPDDTEPKTVYSWVEFSTAGTQRLGKTRGFQQKFMDAYPEYNQGDIAKWRRVGVPAEIMALIPTMPISENDPEYGKDWSDDERAALRVIVQSESKLKNRILAEQLTATFGRLITEGAVKGAKKRLGL
jgi:hypothetical protein